MNALAPSTRHALITRTHPKSAAQNCRSLSMSLMTHLLCARTAGSPGFCAIKLTVPQLSHPRVTPMVTVLRTPARPNLSSTATVYMELVMKNLFARFVKDESGATAIEYGLIAAGISLAIITIVNGLGSNLNAKFTAINGSLK